MNFKQNSVYDISYLMKITKSFHCILLVKVIGYYITSTSIIYIHIHTYIYENLMYNSFIICMYRYVVILSSIKI